MDKGKKVNHIVIDKITRKKYSVTALTFGNEFVIAHIGQREIKFKNPNQQGKLFNQDFIFE